MPVILFKESPKVLTALFFYLLFFSSCKKGQVDPTQQPNESFSYTFAIQGDGLVTFEAAASLDVNEFWWRFGTNASVVKTHDRTIHYSFPANGKYEVSLTYTDKNRESTVTQTVTVSNKLARNFNDLPAGQRDTLRILCVVTHDSFSKEFEDASTFPVDPYQNKVFINFLQRTLPDHPKELDGLVLKKIVCKLSPEEMNRFNAAGDPIAFLNNLFTQQEDPLFQKLLSLKRTEAVSMMTFYLKDPAPGGYSKYGIGGYSVYEGSYFVLLSPGSYVHELGHSFGLAHDTLRSCTYVPIMSGVGTQTNENCNALWNEFPEFQVKGTVTRLAVLRAPNYYDYAVPVAYQSFFPTGTFLRNLDITHLATTPYYKSGVTMSKTITDALITQYNIRQKPEMATRLDVNPSKPDASSNRSINGKNQIVTCKQNNRLDQ